VQRAIGFEHLAIDFVVFDHDAEPEAARGLKRATMAAASSAEAEVVNVPAALQVNICAALSKRSHFQITTLAKAFEG